MTTDQRRSSSSDSTLSPTIMLAGGHLGLLAGALVHLLLNPDLSHQAFREAMLPFSAFRGILTVVSILVSFACYALSGLMYRLATQMNKRVHWSCAVLIALTVVAGATPGIKLLLEAVV